MRGVLLEDPEVLFERILALALLQVLLGFFQTLGDIGHSRSQPDASVPAARGTAAIAAPNSYRSVPLIVFDSGSISAWSSGQDHRALQPAKPVAEVRSAAREGLLSFGRLGFRLLSQS